MFSKPRLSRSILFFLAASLMGLSACSYFLDDKRQEPQTLEVVNAKFSCLQSLPEEMKEFLKGKASERDINSGFDCAKEALLYFKNKTKGTYSEAYSLEDLRNFFGKYFLKNNNVSPEFGTQLFKLKKVVVGGTDYSITKVEIQRVVEILEVMKNQAIQLAPCMGVLLGRKVNLEWEEVDKASSQLRESLWTLFKEVDLVNSDYSFSDFKNFINGLSDFINANEPLLLTEQFSGDVELVEAVKNVLIGEDPHLENINDWNSVVTTAVNFYKEFLRYRYFLKGKELNTRVSVQALLLIAEDGLDLLEEGFSMKHQREISFSSLDHLLDILEARKLLPLELSSLALKEVYKKVVLHILDPLRRGDSRGLNGLEQTHVLALKHELKIYQLHQNMIDNLPLGPLASIGFKDLKNAVENFDPLSVIEKHLTRDSLEQEDLMTAWNEGSGLLLKQYPVFYNEEGRQVIAENPASFRQSWMSLTKWNLMRALSRMLLIGYGRTHSPMISQETMSKEGLEQWYSDFNRIGIELKAFDRRAKDSGKRSFTEANFFTFNGNGDSLMDYFETFDFVSLLISGGRTSSDFIRESMVKAGCGLSTMDIFGYPLLDEGCFKKNFQKNFATYFDNLPGLVREVSKMSEEQWSGFYATLLSAARVSAPKMGQIETADLRTAVMILHYVESLMSVYDANRDGKLSIQELRAAAPRFLLFMKSVSPIQSDFMVEDFFLFLVYKEKKPSLKEYILFQGEKAFDSLHDVGRDKILRVFKVLKDEVI
ncbi:MAG: hypothetical protein ACXVB4_03125 [Pseudobdellovibrionaceae bacterium]